MCVNACSGHPISPCPAQCWLYITPLACSIWLQWRRVPFTPLACSIWLQWRSTPLACSIWLQWRRVPFTPLIYYKYMVTVEDSPIYMYHLKCFAILLDYVTLPIVLFNIRICSLDWLAVCVWLYQCIIPVSACPLHIYRNCDRRWLS